MKGKSHLILAIFLVFIMALSGCGNGGGDGGSKNHSGEDPNNTGDGNGGEGPNNTDGGNGDGNGGNNNKNLTISNHFTGLKWENVSTPHIKVNWYKASGNYDSRYNPDSEYICGECTTGNDGTIWKLPTNDELLTLIDTNNSPTIDDGFNCEEAKYWTSSSLSEGGPAHVIDFEDGQGKTDYKTQKYYVRCVQFILKTVKGDMFPNYDKIYIRIGDLWTRTRGGGYVLKNVHINQTNKTIRADGFQISGQSWYDYSGTIEINPNDTLFHNISMTRIR